MEAFDLYSQMDIICRRDFGNDWTNLQYKLWNNPQYPELTELAKECKAWVIWGSPAALWPEVKITYLIDVGPLKEQPLMISLRSWVDHLQEGRVASIDRQLKHLPYVEECVWDSKGNFYLGIEAFIEHGLEAFASDNLDCRVYGSAEVKFEIADPIIIEGRAYDFYRHRTDRDNPWTAEEFFEEACIDFFEFMEVEWAIEPKGLVEFQAALDFFYEENKELFLLDVKTNAWPDCSGLKKAVEATNALYSEGHYISTMSYVQLCPEWWAAKGWKE